LAENHADTIQQKRFERPVLSLREAATKSLGDSQEPFSAAALSESSSFRDGDSSDKGS
jgi:hypothetical protein